MRPMAFRPRVAALESTNAPPTLSISAFHDITMTTGSRTTMTDERRLRHCVVRSALKRERKTLPGEGSTRGAGRSRAESVMAGEAAVVDICLNIFRDRLNKAESGPVSGAHLITRQADEDVLQCYFAFSRCGDHFGTFAVVVDDRLRRMGRED